jgi:hypothetical protein
MTVNRLTPLTTSQSDGLAVLLKFRDELIALFDDIVVLLVLIVRAISFDNAVHSIDGARNPARSYEFGKVSDIRLESH